MASGDTLLVFAPAANEPPSSAFATFSLRNARPILEFDGAANESAVFGSVMPQHYDGGGIEVYLHYAMDTDVTNDIDWDTAFERVGEGQQDTDSDGFAAVQSVDNTTVPGTAGHVDIVNTSHTNAQIDGILVGEHFRLKVTRDAVSDTSTDDAHLFAVELRET